MKNKRIVSISICFLLLVGVLFISSNNFSIDTKAVVNPNAPNPQVYFNYRSYIEEEDAYYVDNYELAATLDTDNLYFLSNQNIVVSYLVSEDIGIEDFDYTQTGFNVINISIDSDNDRRITAELSCLPEQDEYYLELELLLEDGTELCNNDWGASIDVFVCW